MLKAAAILIAGLLLGLSPGAVGSLNAHKRFANCTHAVATLDSDEHLVDFRVDCEAKICPASLEIAQLFDHFPRGC